MTENKNCDYCSSERTITRKNRQTKEKKHYCYSCYARNILNNEFLAQMFRIEPNSDIIHEFFCQSGKPGTINLTTENEYYISDIWINSLEMFIQQLYNLHIKYCDDLSERKLTFTCDACQFSTLEEQEIFEHFRIVSRVLSTQEKEEKRKNARALTNILKSRVRK